MNRLQPRPKRRKAPWIVLGVLAVALGVGGYLLQQYYAGDPTSGAVASQIRRDAPSACAGNIDIRGIDNLGGPGLPHGMQRMRSIECDQPGGGEPRRLVIHYVFQSGDDARAWLRSGGFRLNVPAKYGWWLHGRTLMGKVNLTVAQWDRIRDSLGG